MKTLLRSLPRAIAAFALLAFASADAWSQTTCDLVFSLADLAAPGEIIDHKTDVSDDDCTIQVNAKVEKVSADETKIELKIDRSCISTGQAQLTGIAIVSPTTSSCDINYNNPADPSAVGENPVIAEVLQLQQLILDAATATALQFPSDPTPILLVAKLTEAATPANIIFVTAAKYNGDLDGLDGADAKCQVAADGATLDGAKLPGTYKAWLSDSTTSAKDRLTQSSGPYVRTDGIQVAADFADLIDGIKSLSFNNIAAPLNVDENGFVLTGSQDAWTGTNVLGQSTIPNCTNWTEGNHEPFPSTGDVAFTANVGLTNFTTFHWTEAGNGSCGLQRHLYCLQQ